jgi:lipid A oxidase
MNSINMTSVFRGAAWTRRPPAPTARGPAYDRASRIAAMAALVLAAGATLVEQAAHDAVPDKSASTPERAAGIVRPANPAGTFVGAYGGVPFTYPSDVTLKRAGVHDLTIKDVAWDGRPFKAPVYYGARVAHWRDEATFGAMLDFTHSKAISRFGDTAVLEGILSGAPAPSRARIGELFKHLEFSHGHNMLTLNGLYRAPRIGARLQPYLGLGAGVSLPHTEIALHTDAQRTYEYQYTGPVAQTLIGIEIQLPRNMVLFVEYKLSIAPYEVPLTFVEGRLLVNDLWGQLQRWLSGAAPIGGYLRTRLTSHMLNVGIGARFQSAPTAAR